MEKQTFFVVAYCLWNAVYREVHQHWQIISAPGKDFFVFLDTWAAPMPGSFHSMFLICLYFCISVFYSSDCRLLWELLLLFLEAIHTYHKINQIEPSMLQAGNNRSTTLNEITCHSFLPPPTCFLFCFALFLHRGWVELLAGKI